MTIEQSLDLLDDLIRSWASFKDEEERRIIESHIQSIRNMLLEESTKVLPEIKVLSDISKLLGTGIKYMDSGWEIAEICWAKKYLDDLIKGEEVNVRFDF